MKCSCVSSGYESPDGSECQCLPWSLLVSAAFFCLVRRLDLTTPETKVVEELLDVPEDHEREGEQQPLVHLTAIRQLVERLHSTPQRCCEHNDQTSETEDGGEETLNHNRSFAIGKRVENLWHTYHRKHPRQDLNL